MTTRQHLEEIIPTLEGWCTVEKAWQMVELIIQRNPSIIVESGVFGGRSILPMAFAARDLGSIVYGIDPWSVEAALEGNESDEAHKEWWSKNAQLGQIYRGFLEKIRHYDLWDHLIPMRMTGHRASKTFEDGSIGFFHLDSNHSEKVSCQEVEDWAPKMTKQSIWVMDDANWPTQQKAIGMILDLGYTQINKETEYMIFERK